MQRSRRQSGNCRGTAAGLLQHTAIAMQIKEVSGGRGSRLWVAILAPGEEVKQTILEWARSDNIEAASFVALGAFQRATIAYFEWDKKQYKPIPIDHQVEVITLIGDVVRNVNDEPDLHAHTVLGLPNGTTRGGHLLEGLVRPTLEVTLTETPANLVRRKKADLGIALIDID
jgi:predicted DNA-binding protein with PD1-like motif